MPSSGHQEESNTETRTPGRDTASGTLDHATEFPPVEMNSLQVDDAMGSTLAQQETHQSHNSTQPRHRPMRTDTVTAIENSRNPPVPPLSPTSQAAELNRTQSTAIGESIDTQPPPPREVESTDAGPTLMITLLLLTGARHPFNLDGKYLAKRNVQVQGNDPFNLSIYKVKELILREWRDDWESKPSSPSAIRLISFGKVLDDKAAIKDLKFNPKAANVVHMSIKPQDFVEEEDAKGSKATRTRSRDGTEGRSPGCRCVIM